MPTDAATLETPAPRARANGNGRSKPNGKHRGPELDSRKLLMALRAFRRGDFSTRLPRDLDGIDGEIAEAFNDIAEMNQGLARELDRVAKVV